MTMDFLSMQHGNGYNGKSTKYKMVGLMIGLNLSIPDMIMETESQKVVVLYKILKDVLNHHGIYGWYNWTQGDYWVRMYQNQNDSGASPGSRYINQDYEQSTPWMDCKTDVIFNALSLIFPYVGHAASVWWLDPLGAGLLSLFIIYDWASTCLENICRLTGAAANDRLEPKPTFLAWRFSPLVTGLEEQRKAKEGSRL
ncbi:hypothetical protein DSL72_004845 [Monilinia vaccinii-corymbosi]|uniref:Uncharacterized protein n=1 Tax=Monilinia vaccinii-corymbosi TaxID=61207 RepID=A0A8A3NXS8_9HELO|nr:hypothetical protein DSL72_004845 [Monilinia vaccinii-corymbosi]